MVTQPASPEQPRQEAAPGGRTTGLSRPRSAALDRLRGLACALMLLDHSLYAFGAPFWTRQNVTRLAMPLFFLLAGHLASRFTPRHGWLVVLGAVLPLVVVWIDQPNVLLWLGLMLPAAALCPRRLLPLVVLLALTVAANGHSSLLLVDGRVSFAPAALAGLVALGRLLPREAFGVGDRLPRWLGGLGRYPLTFYVVHLLLLDLLVVRDLI